MKVAVNLNKSAQDGKLGIVAEDDVKNLFKMELQTKFGHVMPSNIAVKMFGAAHGLPVIDGVISIDAVSRKLVAMRSLALSSAM